MQATTPSSVTPALKKSRSFSQKVGSWFSSEGDDLEDEDGKGGSRQTEEGLELHVNQMLEKQVH